MAVPSGIMAPCIGQLVTILMVPLAWALTMLTHAITNRTTLKPHAFARSLMLAPPSEIISLVCISLIAPRCLFSSLCNAPWCSRNQRALQVPGGARPLVKHGLQGWLIQKPAPPTRATHHRQPPPFCPD